MKRLRTNRFARASRPETARHIQQSRAEFPAHRQDRARLDDDLEDFRLLAGVAQQRTRDDQVAGGRHRQNSVRPSTIPNSSATIRVGCSKAASGKIAFPPRRWGDGRPGELSHIALRYRHGTRSHPVVRCRVVDVHLLSGRSRVARRGHRFGGHRRSSATCADPAARSAARATRSKRTPMPTTSPARRGCARRRAPSPPRLRLRDRARERAAAGRRRAAVRRGGAAVALPTRATRPAA